MVPVLDIEALHIVALLIAEIRLVCIADHFCDLSLDPAFVTVSQVVEYSINVLASHKALPPIDVLLTELAQICLRVIYS